jgi:hypothetical protein
MHRLHHGEGHTTVTHNPKKRRANDGLTVVLGACNPSGIAHSIVEACADCRAEGLGTAQIAADPAIRAMVYQLAFLCQTDELNDPIEYTKLMKELRAMRDGQ